MKSTYDPGDLRGVETPSKPMKVSLHPSHIYQMEVEYQQWRLRYLVFCARGFRIVQKMKTESPARIADRRHAFRDPEPPNLQKWARRLANEGN